MGFCGWEKISSWRPRFTTENTFPSSLLTKLIEITFAFCNFIFYFFLILKCGGVSVITYLYRIIFKYRTTEACKVFLHNAVGNAVDCF